jgi:hypothetical protein
MKTQVIEMTDGSTDTQRVYQVTIPVTYIVVTDEKGEPRMVSQQSAVGERVLWGDKRNSRGRWLGGAKPTTVRRICDEVRRIASV